MFINSQIRRNSVDESNVVNVYTSRKKRTATSEATTNKKAKSVGYGLYTNLRTGVTIQQAGRSSGRIINHRNVKQVGESTGEVGFKPHGLKFKGKAALTSRQLQVERANI